MAQAHLAHSHNIRQTPTIVFVKRDRVFRKEPCRYHGILGSRKYHSPEVFRGFRPNPVFRTLTAAKIDCQVCKSRE